MMQNWRLTERLDTILDRSIDRLDEDTPEDIVHDYPQSANQLAPMLHVADALRELGRVKMRRAAKEVGRARLRQAVLARQQRRSGWFGVPGGLRMAAWAVLFLVVCIGSLSSITVVSAQALPNEPLYGWKRTSERIWLSIQSNPERKIAVSLALADRRVEEIRQLHRRSGSVSRDVIVQLRADYIRTLELIAALPNDQAKPLLEQAHALSAQHEQELMALAEQATGSQQQMILSAVQASQWVQSATPDGPVVPPTPIPAEPSMGAPPTTIEPGSPDAAPKLPRPSPKNPPTSAPIEPPAAVAPGEPAAPKPTQAPAPPAQPGTDSPPAAPKPTQAPAPPAQPGTDSPPAAPQPTDVPEPPKTQPTDAPVPTQPGPPDNPPGQGNPQPPGPPSTPPGQGYPPPGSPNEPPGNPQPGPPDDPPGKGKDK
ncbi:MAG TPA: DUF5667 domain-containing protein [Herpetosiphonaceae bacterium]